MLKMRSNDFSYGGQGLRTGAWLGISLCDVHLLLGQILSSPAHLGPCRFLYVITYQKIHCFYEVLHRTSDNGKTLFNSQAS